MIRKVFRWIWKATLWFIGLSILSVIIFKWVPVPITPLMITRAVENKLEGKDALLTHDWVSIENISPNLQKAVIASEDGNFLKHNGFDFKAMQKAFKNNNKGRRIKGGSTISQQTAKNVFLWQGRSYIRKAFEAYFTVLIEIVWGKERIMEVYLNSIEMGKGVYGAEAAANYWFKKGCDKLSKDESAAIAAILPNPLKYVANPPSQYVQKRKAWIKQQMSFWGNQTILVNFKE